MKERIKELARQSGGIDITNHTAGGVTVWVGTGTPEFLEKFAELIVKEVLSKIDDEGFEVYKPVVEAVKKHFEVE
jgi:hypothetical protein